MNAPLPTPWSVHTPGPWTFVKEANTENRQNWTIHVGTPDDIGGWLVECATCTLGNAEEDAEDEANIRLMAAAPELLAALQELDRCIEVAWERRDLPAVVFSGDLIRKYRAAIRKATGEQP